MTLHEAIITILTQTDGMTTAEIADAINSQSLYTKRDGSPLQAGQVSARIRREEYSHLFRVNDRRVYLRN